MRNTGVEVSLNYGLIARKDLRIELMTNVSYNKNDLLKFRNFGKKSLTELEELVQTKQLTFGMNLAKYKLDKD
jgi:DNA-directed RNA polymerase alpha subunit